MPKEGCILSKNIKKAVFFVLLGALCLSLKGMAQSVEGAKINCVVIDAGHGGYDKGCISPDKKTYEKSIALAVALKVGEKIKRQFPDVKVVYTRKTDVFVPLDKRAEIANKNKADLFISVHVNSAKGKASGTETFTMGNHVSGNNFEVSKRENSVILLEDDYTAKYEGFDPASPESYIIFSLLQNAYAEQSLKFAQYVQAEYKKGPITASRGVKQAGFLVLWKTTMPSVLTEIGFMTNNVELASMRSLKGREAIAGRLAEAFAKYKKEYEKGSVPPRQKTSQQKTSRQKSEYYIIQILSVGRPLKENAAEFKGRKNVQYYKGEDGMYKYYVGKYDSREAAARDLNGIKKSFKGAFIKKIAL